MQNQNYQPIDKLDVGIDTTSPSNKVVWSTGRNVRFTPGFVSKTLGKSVLATLPTASLNVRAIFTFMDFGGAMRNIVCTDSNVYALDSNYTTLTDITCGSLSGGENDLWDFTIVAGLPILTNGKDGIWKWPDPASGLVPLQNFPLCKNISCCMHRLVGSNVRSSTGFWGIGYIWYTGRVVWSETGNPENVVIDTSRKTGQFDLVNYQDGEDVQHNIICQIVDGSKVYYFTERNVWVTDFAQPIKQFIIIDDDFQLLSSQSATIDKGIIYAADKRDIYTFTGGQKKPIGLPIKKELFANINQSALNSVFSFPMWATNEIWFCVPTGTSAVADTAYVYNWELANWSILDCDFLCHGKVYAPFVALRSLSLNIAWQKNSLAEVTWNNLTPALVNWVSTLYNVMVSKDVCGDSASHILQMDSWYNAINTSLAPVAINGIIESGDFSMGNRAFQKVIEECYPDLAAQTSVNSLMVQVGIRENLSLPINWGPVISFRIGVDFYADLRNYTSQGAHVRLRFYTNIIDSPWSMSSYGFNFSMGERIR